MGGIDNTVVAGSHVVYDAHCEARGGQSREPPMTGLGHRTVAAMDTFTDHPAAVFST